MAVDEITAFQLSFIWVETQPGLLQREVPAQAPLAFVGDSYDYQDHFDTLQQNGELAIGDIVLQLPSPRPRGQVFWRYYLEEHSLHKISGAQAWKSLVPFRYHMPGTIRATDDWRTDDLRLSAQGYFYPHGLAFVVRAAYMGEALSLDEMVQLALRVRRSGRYDVQWPTATYDNISLNALADRGQDALHALMLGEDAAPGQRHDPFTIATITRGEGTGDDMTIHEEVQRRLHALVHWSPTYQQDTLASLDEARLPVKESNPPTNVIYRAKRGRAIWFPKMVIDPRPRVALKCYHQNMVFASLQTASLGSLVQHVARHDQAGTLRALPDLEYCSARAGGILGRFYGGANIYRTWSTRAQIDDQDGLVEATNYVRRLFGTGPPLA